MTQQQRNQTEWANPANWRWGVYRSDRDTRVWVPKQVPWMGWTLNFAHPAAKWWLLALLSPALIVVMLLVLRVSF